MPESLQSRNAESESARHVLACRAFPALRHALVGELQAIKFASSMARCIGATGCTDETLAALARLDEAADRSIARALALSTWLQPEPDVETGLAQATDECIELVRTQWRIRGIEIQARVPAAVAPVRAWPVRELLAASLFALGDSLEGACDVSLLVRRRPAAVLVAARVLPARREVDGPQAAWPRPLCWADVDALARTHSATCRRRGHRMALRIPA